MNWIQNPVKTISSMPSWWGGKFQVCSCETFYCFLSSIFWLTVILRYHVENRMFSNVSTIKIFIEKWCEILAWNLTHIPTYENKKRIWFHNFPYFVYYENVKSDQAFSLFIFIVRVKCFTRAAAECVKYLLSR